MSQKICRDLIELLRDWQTVPENLTSNKSISKNYNIEFHKLIRKREGMRTLTSSVDQGLEVLTKK